MRKKTQAGVARRGVRRRRVDPAPRNRLQRLHDAGVWIRLDTLSRELLENGAFAALVSRDSVTGATSNRTIFARAITGSDRCDDQRRSAVAAGVDDSHELFLELALGRRRSRRRSPAQTRCCPSAPISEAAWPSPTPVAPTPATVSASPTSTGAA